MYAIRSYYDRYSSSAEIEDNLDSHALLLCYAQEPQIGLHRLIQRVQLRHPGLPVIVS